MNEPSAPLPLVWDTWLQAHPLAHFVYDTDSFALLAVNDAALRRYGYEREEFLRLTRGDLLQPGQVELLRSFIDALPASARADPQHVWLERTRDGRVLHADIRGLPVLFDGRPARLAAVVDATARRRDITELEQRFRAMADAAPVAIFMTDPGGACTYANAAWQDLYGLAGAAALGQAWAEALHPDDQAAVYREWLRCAAVRLSFAMEFRLRRADGSERRVAARSNPIVNAAGAITGHVGTVTDLTAALDLEAARRAQAVAEEAGRRQAAFMSRVSHELRTPLNAILGFGQLLEDGGVLSADRANGYAHHVVQAGRHMLALVDDLLELQHLEQGRLQPAKEPVALGPLLAACAELLAPMASAAAVQLEVDAEPGLAVASDERCLRQIVLNLGSNAIKYGHAPGQPGQVRLRATRTGTGGCRIAVADDGPGLQPAQLARLFQPFERLGQQTGGQPGSGLGLVITKQLAQLLGGDVALHSVPGRGTTATLELPP